MNSRAVRRAGLALALAATAGCAGGSSMAETIESVFERNPEKVAETCSTTAAMASSRDELLSLLDSLSDEQRSDMQAAMAMAADEAIPVEAAAWDWSDVREWMGGVWDECEDRGLI